MGLIYSALDEALIDSLQQPDVTLAIALMIEFPSGVTRVHSGTGYLTINGQQFVGVGAMGEISAVKEDGGLTTNQVNIALNGLDTSIMGTVMNERCVGSPAELYFATFDSNMDAIAVNLLYKGYICASGMTAGNTNAIAYTLSTVFEKWKDGGTGRWTEESHNHDNPGDHIMRYVNQTAERTINWGAMIDAPAYVRYD